MAMHDEEHELTDLLERLHTLHGFDLRGYARASLLRRVRQLRGRLGVSSTAELLSLLERERGLRDVLVDTLTVQVSDMFRDPEEFGAFRKLVVPGLRSYPVLRLWCAGCASGEEPYSLAILLHEEGLLERALIYATDLSERAVTQAKRGVFAARHVRRFTENYRAAGGKASFSDYYTAAYNHLVMQSWLKKNIVFFQHDLVCDRVFASMHVVFMRNVLIYFARDLQHRVLENLEHALEPGAVVCLGNSERLAQGSQVARFSRLGGSGALYRWNTQLRDGGLGFAPRTR